MALTLRERPHKLPQHNTLCCELVSEERAVSINELKAAGQMSCLTLADNADDEDVLNPHCVAEDPDEWKPVGLCGQPRQGSHDQGRCTCDGAEGKVHMQDSPAKRTRKRKAEPVVLRRKYHRKPKADKKEKSKPVSLTQPASREC